MPLVGFVREDDLCTVWNRRTSHYYSYMKPFVVMDKAAFVWFRNTDLRLRDHHPLFQAARSASRVYPIVCFDTDEFLPRKVRGDVAMQFPKLGPFRLWSASCLRTRLWLTCEPAEGRK